MKSFFNDFADSGIGSWIINVLAVMAGFIGLKVLVSRFSDQGIPGAFKAAVNFA
jgi:hypothetical protein